MGFKPNNLYSQKNAWCFVAPALIGTAIFIIIPIFASFLLSFYEWDLLSKPLFVGWENYLAIFSTPIYGKIFINTIYYAICVTLFGVSLPLVLAYLVVSKFKYVETFKFISLLPYITPMVVIGTVWVWIFDPASGLINNLFHANIKWLYDMNLAMPILIFVSVWKLIGYNMILFLTGFANINLSLIEAAQIDGANNAKIFTKIIMPLLVPTIVFVSVVTIISSFQVFDLIYIMTQGGPENATEVVVYSVYKEGFEYFDTGKSCALGYILFIAILVINGLLVCAKRMIK